MKRIFRVIGWLLIFAIVTLSLVPPTSRPVTGAGHISEHIAIFFLSGMALGLGYPGQWRTLTMRLLLFCGAIELAQYFVPGRHARMSDFMVDAAAICSGLLASIIALRTVK